MTSAFDLEAIRSRRRCAARLELASGRLPRHAVGERFLRGPIPWNWIAAAAALPGHALHVGVALWHAGYLKGGSATVSFSATAMKKIGVSRYAAMRGLAQLERAGLVAVDNGRGRKALVTILPVPTNPTPENP